MTNDESEKHLDVLYPPHKMPVWKEQEHFKGPSRCLVCVFAPCVCYSVKPLKPDLSKRSAIAHAICID